MRKVIIGFLIAATALISGCGQTPDGADPLATAAASNSVAPVPTGSQSIVDPTAAKDYRTALEKSLAAQSASGLTEIWNDPEGNLAQVVAYDSVSQKAAQHDIISDDVQELDASAMMPTVLLDELDALEGNSVTDLGSVSSQIVGTFTVLNHVDDSKYITIYTLDEQGRIARAEVSVDDELSAVATFTYALTAEGKTALAKLK